MNKNLIQSLIGIIIGAAFLFFTLYNKPVDQIVDSLSKADTGWMLLNGLILLAVFVLRALRWSLLLQNAGEKPRTRKVFYSLILGYFVNSFTPKFGEVIRCTSLKKNGDIPVAKSLGTVVSERIYDLLVLLAGVTVIMLMELKRLGNILRDITDNLGSTISDHWLIFSAGFAVFILIIFIVSRIFRKSKLYVKVKVFIREILITVKGTFKIKKYWLFLLYTVLIWIILAGLNYTFLCALPETKGLSLYFAVVILFIGGIGWAFPSPGGIGTTHFFVLHLFITFGLSEQAGLAFGVLSNGLTFIYTIFFGLVAMAIHFIFAYKSVKKPAVTDC
ncbi:MAG: lysylphosphatidylglycerol synthase transmembrane domain-containing protein [Bacteroidota bacterium]